MSKRLVRVFTFLVLGMMMLVSYTNCSKRSFSSTNPTAVDPLSESPDATDGGGDPEDPNPPPLPPTTPPDDENHIQEKVTIDVNKAVDVLIVMDNSGSMANEQKKMGEKFANFTDYLKIPNLDWHLGIITTDSKRSQTDGLIYPLGNLVSFTTNGSPTGDKFLDSSMQESFIAAAFLETIYFPTAASGAEQGIGATYAFLSKVDDKPENADYRAMIRDSAALSVILVSDSDESSCASNHGSRCDGSADQHFNKIENLKNLVKQKFGASKKFVWNSIIVKPGDKACEDLTVPVLDQNGNQTYDKNGLPYYAWENEMEGLRYAQLSQETQGVIGSVCESSYSSQLTNIGSVTADLVTKSMQLKCVPIDKDGDNKPDLVIKNKNMIVVTNYVLSGSVVKFDQALEAGDYSLDYYCK
ncbi:MAG: hypothetical protein AB7O96_16290 [Pseudobdellovibrionaceae bacterium]